MKALKLCCNGDGRPVQPPSKVLCKECLNGIGETLRDMLEELKGKEQK